MLSHLANFCLAANDKHLGRFSAPRLRRLAWVVVALGVVACGRPRADNQDSADDSLSLVLKPVGAVSVSGYPGQSLSLKVAAFLTAGSKISDASDLVAADGEVVQWTLSSVASGATLSTDASLTDASGFTSVTVNTGTLDALTLQVVASAGDAKPIVFSVQVLVDTKEVIVLGNSPLDTVVDRSERVRVRVVRTPSGIPVVGTALQVALVDGARNGAKIETGNGSADTVTTDASGIASVRFFTGSNSGLTYRLEFCGQNSCPGVAPASVELAVGARDNGSGCQYFTDCEDGFTCVEGSCEPAALYCAEDADCPTGYACNEVRECEVDTSTDDCVTEDDCEEGEICGAADVCIPDDGCESSLDCPDGWTCDFDSGACLPDGEPVIDVRGLWSTRYHFDISDTLPGLVTALEPVVTFLDLVFRSQLEIDVPILGDILEAVIDEVVAQYVPDWVKTVTTVLGDIILLFQNLEVVGEMALQQFPVSPLGTEVSGEEQWSNAELFISSLCPGGIAEFQIDRSCGKVDVALEQTFALDYSNNDPEVGVKVDPFTGQVQGQTLRLFDREAAIELRQLVNVVLDIVVSVASNGQWYDFEEFLVDIIPCGDLQDAVNDLADDLTDGAISDVPGIEEICEAAATAATIALTDALGDIPVALNLEFEARALIHDDNGVQPVALVLGDPDDPEDTNESALVGETDFTLLGGELDTDSWWFGEK